MPRPAESLPNATPSRDGHSEPPVWLGMDIGGSSIKAGVIRPDGEVLGRLRLPLPLDRGPETAVESICAAVAQLLRQSDLRIEDVAVAGIAAPGTLDLDAGVILHPFNLPGWENLPIAEIMQHKLGVPTILLNDANAAAFGEYWAGRHDDVLSLMLWTLGTGIGAGIVLGGQLLQGAHGHAGECGHMIVQMDGGLPSPHGVHGALELYAGARGLVQRCEAALSTGQASLMTGWIARGDALTPRLIADAAEQSDPLALQLILESARYLAVGTVNVMHMLNPELILLGGAMTFGGADSELGRRFLGAVRDYVSRTAFPVPAAGTRIEFASLGNDAGFIGAAAYAAASLNRHRYTEQRSRTHAE